MTPIYYGRVLFVAQLQRGHPRARRPRPVQPEGDRVLHPAGDREDRQAVRRSRRGRALQGRDSDQQRRGRRSRLHLHRRSREHGAAHPRARRRRAPRGELPDQQHELERPASRTVNSQETARRKAPWELEPGSGVIVAGWRLQRFSTQSSRRCSSANSCLSSPHTLRRSRRSAAERLNPRVECEASAAHERLVEFPGVRAAVGRDGVHGASARGVARLRRPSSG